MSPVQRQTLLQTLLPLSDPKYHTMMAFAKVSVSLHPYDSPASQKEVCKHGNWPWP